MEGSISSYLIGEQTSQQFLASLIEGMFGMIASFIIQIIYFRKKIQDKGGFSFVRWIQDNIGRVILSLMVITVGAAKGNLITGELSMWGCIGVGFMSDKVVEAILKYYQEFQFPNPFKSNRQTDG